MTLHEWATERDVVAIYFHGSRAEGRARADSDADVAVLLEHEPDDWEIKEQWAEQLADLLAPQLQVKASQVDVQFLNSAPPAFQFRVIRDRRLLWEAQDYRRATFETRLISEYLDFRYYEEMYDAAQRQRIKEGRFGDRPEFHTKAVKGA